MTYFAIVTLYQPVKAIEEREATIWAPKRRGYIWDGGAYHKEMNCFATEEYANEVLRDRRVREIEAMKKRIVKLEKLLRPGW